MIPPFSNCLHNRKLSYQETNIYFIITIGVARKLNYHRINFKCKSENWKTLITHWVGNCVKSVLCYANLFRDQHERNALYCELNSTQKSRSAFTQGRRQECLSHEITDPPYWQNQSEKLKSYMFGKLN